MNQLSQKVTCDLSPTVMRPLWNADAMQEGSKYRGKGKMTVVSPVN